jgi:protein-disulfide isomerase
MKSYIWIGAVIIILIGLMFWGVSSGNNINPPFAVDAVHPLDHVQGNATSSVVVIEYSDFECPACRSYYSVMKQLMVEFGSRVAFVYRDFPLIEIHANSEFAARAAEAAGKQGKFWEMHDLLFEKQDEWASAANPEVMFESYAVLLGISIKQFKIDFGSKEIGDFVKAERASAIKLKLSGTPTFFINGKQIENPNSVDAFRVLISDAIKSKT